MTKKIHENVTRVALGLQRPENRKELCRQVRAQFQQGMLVSIPVERISITVDAQACWRERWTTTSFLIQLLDIWTSMYYARVVLYAMSNANG